jgi:hypothetical protein
MTARYATRLQALRELLMAVARRDPSVSSQETVLVAAAVFVLVAMLVVLLLLVLTPRKRRVVRRRRVVRSYALESDAVALDHATQTSGHPGGEQVAVESAPSLGRRPLSRLLLGAPAMALAAILVVVATYEVSGTTVFCTFQCHQDMTDSPEVVQQRPLTASTVSTVTSVGVQAEPSHHQDCTGCHRSDVISNIADRTRMIVAAFVGSSDSSASAVIDSASCVRCHRDVFDGVTLGADHSMRMSHKEPYAAGIACIRCHQRLGHDGARSPVMYSCVECHDSVTAASECGTCHTGRPSDQATRHQPENSASKRTYTLAYLDSNRCYGCHRPAPCDSCHDVRLPHTADFLEDGHAYRAAWSGKRLCYRCHNAAECMDCHQSFAPGSNHYSGWERDHSSANPKAGCTCHDRRRRQRTESFCTVCH